MKIAQKLTKAFIAAIAVFGLSNSASADVILTFGQSGNSNTVTATNPTASSTSISGTNVGVTVTQISPSSGLATPFSAFLNFSIHSSGAASTLGGVFAQQYTGTFSVTSGANGSGTNYLSDSTPITFELVGSTTNSSTFNLFSNDPGGFTSGVISNLTSPTGVSLSLGNITGAASSTSLNAGGTVNPFSGSISGNFSAGSSSSTPVVPEPSVVGMMAVAGIGWVLRSLQQGRLNLFGAFA